MININWQTVSAVATASAAAITALMVWFTKEALSQSKKHHQDNLRPLLVLEPSRGIEPKDRSRLLKFEEVLGKHMLSISCELRNIGAGPALNPKLHLRIMGVGGYGFTQSLSPVRAGQALWSLEDASAATFEVPPSANYNLTDHALAAGSLWQLVLEYEDVFGRRFHTIHSKDATRPWTVSGLGSVSAGR